MAKEALFNILQNRLDFEGIHALDLFAGTGNITFELASRGVTAVTAVDIHFKCIQYIRSTAEKMRLGAIKAIKADSFKFLVKSTDSFDLIFADPPYDLPGLPQLPGQVFQQQLLRKNGLLILEHPSARQVTPHPALVDSRKYGYSSFSFYQA